MRGQFVRAELDGAISVLTKEPGTSGLVVQVPRCEVERVLEDEKPIDIDKPA